MVDDLSLPAETTQDLALPAGGTQGFPAVLTTETGVFTLGVDWRAAILY